MERWPRIIAHADMDAFYAAVEQRDRPALRGKPVLVGPRSRRGVVLTASYEARAFGVGSAMSVGEAIQRCPHAVMVPPDFDKYQAVSARIMDIFADFSPAVEALSLDEAFLDMSGAERFFGTPSEMGAGIKAAVHAATGLHISVGLAATKYVAKVASAHDKPDGLTVVPPQATQQWLAPLPIKRLWGVGPKTSARLADMDLITIGDVARLEAAVLEERLGALGRRLHQLSHGVDPRRVERGRTARSIGSDRTLRADVRRPEDIRRHLLRAADRIARRLRGKGYVAHGVRVRLKTSAHQLLTRQRQLTVPGDTAALFFQEACELLEEFAHPGPFRLVGMAVFDLHWREAPQQLSLFHNPSARRLETTIDRVLERYGKQAVIRARDLENAATVHNDGVNLDFMDVRQGERVSRPG